MGKGVGLMYAREFDSILSSPLGAAIKSPLNVRETGGISTFYLSAVDRRTDPPGVRWDEKLFSLQAGNFESVVSESRAPWWPSPHPDWNQNWISDSISGDGNTIWYSAIDLRDLFALDNSWTIDVFRLSSTFEIVDQWRWPSPPVGAGFANRTFFFGTSDVLWALAFIVDEQDGRANLVPLEVRILELDPVTLEIRRSSQDLWGSLSPQERLRHQFVGAGGTSSIIRTVHWLLPDFPVQASAISIISEYSPTDFSFIRTFDAPRVRSPLSTIRRVIDVGGDIQSIRIISDSPTFGTNPGGRQFQRRLSELPPTFSDTNRTIIQDEVSPPWPYPNKIS